ncbi:MAG: hypothetical protein ACOC42_03875, partial [Halobacteriota archaeon]
GLTLLLGVLWELLEVVTRDLSRYFGTDPLLVPYGRWDTASDLVFDGVGALLVLALDVRVFEDAAGRFPDATVALVTVVAWVATVGTLLVGFAVVAYRTELFDGGSRGRSDR